MYNLEYLGGYELMRDGTKSKHLNTNVDLCNYLNDYETFYNMKKEELNTILNNLNSDSDAEEFLRKSWNERWNDGGGWATFEAKSNVDLLQTIKSFEFDHYDI